VIAAWLADLLLLLHLAFVAFVVLGGFLVARWPRLAWLHVPAFLWGALVNLMGWVCPLTPWEQRLRRAAGEAGYEGGFVEHYIAPLVYPQAPADLPLGLVLGVGVLVLNGLAYGRLLRVRFKNRAESC